MHVCVQLRQLRCNLNLSQERFGRRLGISGKSVSAYETGRCVPTVRVLKHIADEFNVNFTEMSSENRIYLNKRIEELENSFTQLKSVLSEMLSL
ncbi:MAG: helix-turn-helix transcriptional regulator [Patescibacteria group bacterium]